MKLAVSGTYSSGKTRTVMALSHYTGIPRTLAKAIREILPSAVPGKKLAEVTPAEFLQLMLRRHTGRAVQEGLLGDHFLSDGSSLQEWLYGAARVRHGMNPNATAHRDQVPVAEDEMAFFAKVVDQFGFAFKQHVKGTYDAFVHLRHELPITDDGHRPMNERFREIIDDMLLVTLAELDIPVHVVSGGFAERITAIVERFDLPTVMPLPDAIALADDDYAALDLRLETERAVVATG
ncbi:AAA domain-containing protein [Herbihabitans rhizosphaerae]|uniref:AAA domain-containing protein n=1 Tax=Herbihabitans rhizosphaerae TaxID=1872711 RepID=A0A4Q7L7U3_9PSEU|nr:AAA family ATPase [Herbihabitans rhizosphaerae]RZS44442.1 AAA domain-containing protein [Herbihabitans rhizosphaerae]